MRIEAIRAQTYQQEANDVDAERCVGENTKISEWRCGGGGVLGQRHASWRHHYGGDNEEVEVCSAQEQKGASPMVHAAEEIKQRRHAQQSDADADAAKDQCVDAQSMEVGRDDLDGREEAQGKASPGENAEAEEHGSQRAGEGSHQITAAGQAAANHNCCPRTESVDQEVGCFAEHVRGEAVEVDGPSCEHWGRFKLLQEGGEEDGLTPCDTHGQDVDHEKGERHCERPASVYIAESLHLGRNKDKDFEKHLLLRGIFNNEITTHSEAVFFNGTKI